MTRSSTPALDALLANPITPGSMLERFAVERRSFQTDDSVDAFDFSNMPRPVGVFVGLDVDRSAPVPRANHPIDVEPVSVVDRIVGDDER